MTSVSSTHNPLLSTSPLQLPAPVPHRGPARQHKNRWSRVAPRLSARDDDCFSKTTSHDRWSHLVGQSRPARSAARRAVPTYFLHTHNAVFVVSLSRSSVAPVKPWLFTPWCLVCSIWLFKNHPSHLVTDYQKRKSSVSLAQATAGSGGPGPRRPEAGWAQR